MYYYEMRVVLNEFQKGYALTDGERVSPKTQLQVYTLKRIIS